MPDNPQRPSGTGPRVGLVMGSRSDWDTMVIVAISVQMFLDGLTAYLHIAAT